jgi:hypothetical protein
MTRDETALRLLCSIVAADWKLDLTTYTWDEAAVKRAYELADVMIQHSKQTQMDLHND